MKIINFSTFFILFFVALRFLETKGIEMMMEDSRQIIYSRNTLEFVTVAVEFCGYLEQAEGWKRAGVCGYDIETYASSLSESLSCGEGGRQ